MHIAHLHICTFAHLHISQISTLAHQQTWAKFAKFCNFFPKSNFFLGLDTAENEPCKDLQKVCKILQDLQKFVKFCKTCKIFLQKFRQKFWQTLKFSRIFLEFFGIFRNFQKNVWNFLLPTNHRYRTTARSAPVDTASTPQLQLLQGSKQRQKVPGSQLQVLRSIKNQNSIFFLIFKDFKIFIAREARPPQAPLRDPVAPSIETPQQKSLKKKS